MVSGVNGAVEGSVQKTGGETNCVSWAYGPIAKMDVGPPGEKVKGVGPAGERVREAGSDWREEVAGDEGGTVKGSWVSGFEFAEG